MNYLVLLFIFISNTYLMNFNKNYNDNLKTKINNAYLEKLLLLIQDPDTCIQPYPKIKSDTKLVTKLNIICDYNPTEVIYFIETFNTQNQTELTDIKKNIFTDIMKKIYYAE